MAVVLIPLLGCARSDDPPATTGAESPPPRQVTDSLRVIETSLGRAAWILEAVRAEHDTEENVTYLTRIEIRFFDRDGALESTLTASEGEADRASRHLISRGDVRVETREGYLLETEVLEWDNGRKKILSDRPVRITQGRNVYTGVGLISDPGLEEFEILEDFRGTVIDHGGDGAEGDGTDEREP